MQCVLLSYPNPLFLPCCLPAFPLRWNFSPKILIKFVFEVWGSICLKRSHAHPLPVVSMCPVMWSPGSGLRLASPSFNSAINWDLMYSRSGAWNGVGQLCFREPGCVQMLTDLARRTLLNSSALPCSWSTRQMWDPLAAKRMIKIHGKYKHYLSPVKANKGES